MFCIDLAANKSIAVKKALNWPWLWRSGRSPFTPMIRIWIPLTPTFFSVKFVFEMIENKQKEAWLDHLKIVPIVQIAMIVNYNSKLQL